MAWLNIDSVRDLAKGDQVSIQNCEGGTMVKTNMGKTCGFQATPGQVEQVWEVADISSDATKVALKCMHTGGFLAPQNTYNGVQCLTTAPLCWWEVMPGSRDGSIGLKVPGSNNVYLCLNYGRPNNNNPVFTWAFAPVFHARMSWWLRSPAGVPPATKEAPRPAADSVKGEDVETREKEWQAKEKEWQAKEKEWQAKEKEWQAKETECKAQRTEFAAKEKEWQAKEKDWQAKETECQAQKTEFASKEREWQSREQKLQTKLKELQAGLEQNTTALKAKQQELEEAQKHSQNPDRVSEQQQHDHQLLVTTREPGYPESEEAEYTPEDWAVEKQSLEAKIAYLKNQIQALQNGNPSALPRDTPEANPQPQAARLSSSSSAPLKLGRGFKIPPPLIGLEYADSAYERSADRFRLKDSGYQQFSFLKRL